MTDIRRRETLSDAFEEFSVKIPLENRPLIRRITDKIGVSHYEFTSGYMKAIRRDGGPTLRIGSGWTDGFTSIEELHAAAGNDVEWWPTDRKNLFGVWHPVNRGYEGGPRLKGKPDTTDYGVCPQCMLLRTATGACGCD